MKGKKAVKRGLKQARELFSLSLKDFKRKTYHQFFPVKPTVVNLNANDICNSKCVMCNIWEQKQGKEISPAELEAILNDELYSEVKHIGITGGEPTLREDLPELYQAVINALPDIEGLSIITNCIQEKQVIERIEKVAEVCKNAGVGFSMMVSLDGVGEIHEQVRGREGNFETAINVINHFKNKIPLAVGCTISKINVWEVDEMLDYLIENNIYGRFRVAEFINRLYNDNKAEVVRNFTDDETYHLALFFQRLELNFERNPEFKRTYRSIHNILTGGERLIGCPYQSKGVVLNSRGELAYCAPKSKVIGDSLSGSSLKIFNKNLDERRRIIDKNCDDCIHDYHAPITYSEYKNELIRTYSQKLLSIKHARKAEFLSTFLPAAKNPFKNNFPIVFVFGWYGTETVGDKAILGGIIDEYREQFDGKVNFVVGSLYPFITIRTMQELEEPDIHIIDSRAIEFLQYCKLADYLVMGGGPLMDLDELYLAFIAFKLGKKYNKTNVVFGCGIGPLFNKHLKNTVKEIIYTANDLRLRDYKSLEVAKEWCAENITPVMSGDSAKRFVLLRDKVITVEKKKNVLSCFLREWTHEYSKQLTHQEFLEERKTVESAMAKLLKQKAAELGVESINLCHMHNYTIGNDDREFSRRFIKEHFSDYSNITYDKGLSTVDSTIKAMKESKFNICMRFHSMLFAESLQLPFLAIDYTLGGKIYNYLKDADKLDHLISMDELKKQFHEVAK